MNNAFGPMAASSNHDVKLRSIVERVNDIDIKISTHNDSEAWKEWEEHVAQAMAEPGEDYWDDLGDWDLERAEEFGNHIITKYNIK